MKTVNDKITAMKDTFQDQLEIMLESAWDFNHPERMKIFCHDIEKKKDRILKAVDKIILESGVKVAKQFLAVKRREIREGLKLSKNRYADNKDRREYAAYAWNVDLSDWI